MSLAPFLMALRRMALTRRTTGAPSAGLLQLEDVDVLGVEGELDVLVGELLEHVVVGGPLGAA